MSDRKTAPANGPGLAVICMAACSIAGIVCGIAFAQDAAPAPVEAQDTALAAAAKDLPADVGKPRRDPFAPVGVRAIPPAKGGPDQPTNTPPPAVVVTNWSSAERQLKISFVGAGQDGKMIAMINGKVLGVGERLTVVTDRVMYTWSVKSISKQTGVQLNRLNARPMIDQKPKAQETEQKKEEGDENANPAET